MVVTSTKRVDYCSLLTLFVILTANAGFIFVIIFRVLWDVEDGDYDYDYDIFIRAAKLSVFIVGV